VVSPNSVDKDTGWLMSAYQRAGIPEYWLVDARSGDVRFEIYKRGKKGYRGIEAQDGWIRSPVLSRSFRMRQTTDESGDREYTLEVK